MSRQQNHQGRELMATSKALSDTRNHWLNAERVNVYSWIFLVIFTIFLGSLIHESFISTTAKDPRPDRDFITFYAAAELAQAGKAVDAYDLEKMYAAEKAVWAKSEKYAWFYPPTFHAVVKPLVILDYKPAFATFMLLTLLFYVFAASRLAPIHTILFPLLAFPAVLVNLIYGQNAFLTAGLGMLAFAYLEKKPWLAGMCIGLLAIKPHMAVLFPLVLICGRHGQAFISAAITATLVCLVSTWLIGYESWPAFFHSLTEARQFLESGQLRWSQMISLFSAVKQLGGSTTLAYSVHIAYATVLSLLCAYVWLNSRDMALRASSLVLASLHFSPYMYDYELVWMAIPLILMSLRGVQQGWIRGEREILLLAWLFPFIDLTISRTLAPNLFLIISVALSVLILIHLKKVSPSTAQET